MTHSKEKDTGLTRRDFVRAAAATVALPLLAEAADPPPIRIGLIGCGGRGTGAAHDCITSSKNIELVAMGDLYADRLARSRQWLAKQGHAVADEACFTGFDAYRRVLETDIDLVLLASPPGFRPIHFEAAIAAGKHVFMEKPVAVDPVGVRKVLAAGEAAQGKNLAVVAGTQYRHHNKFIETIGQVHAGRIGPVLAGRAYYNSGGVWYRPRKQGMNDMEYQTRNWYYFCWTCGDQIVEQHIHTIDVTNWVMGGHPVRAVATGGRAARTGPKYGNIYDSMTIDYEYAGGAHVMSMCRHWKGTAHHVGATFVGSNGEASPYQGYAGDWKFEGKAPNPYVQEHADLIASIRAGAPLNEARSVAESTLTAIMGREAAYTGAVVTWEDMMKSELDLSPPAYEFGDLPVRPLPVPGKKR